MVNNVNEKVRIPKKVAEAIEYFRRPPEFNNEEIVETVVKDRNCGPHSAALIEYAKGNFDRLIKALYIGYEIEQPPKKITLELTLEELVTIRAALYKTDWAYVSSYAARQGWDCMDIVAVHGKIVDVHREARA